MSVHSITSASSTTAIVDQSQLQSFDRQVQNVASKAFEIIRLDEAAKAAIKAGFQWPHRHRMQNCFYADVYREHACELFIACEENDVEAVQNCLRKKQYFEWSEVKKALEIAVRKDFPELACSIIENAVCSKVELILFLYNSNEEFMARTLFESSFDPNFDDGKLLKELVGGREVKLLSFLLERKTSDVSLSIEHMQQAFLRTKEWRVLQLFLKNDQFDPVFGFMHILDSDVSESDLLVLIGDERIRTSDKLDFNEINKHALQHGRMMLWTWLRHTGLAWYC